MCSIKHLVFQDLFTLQYQFRYLQIDKNLNLRQKTSRPFFFKKRFSKLDFLEAVSVTMTANSEEIKIKKSQHHYKFFIFSLLSPDDFLKIGSPPTQFLLSFTPPPPPPPHPIPLPSFKKGRGLGTIYIHLKIYETMFASFCVFPLEFFDVFLMFYCILPILIPTFFEQTKHKASNRFYSPTDNSKPM